jgi:hypothetical protein
VSALVERIIAARDRLRPLRQAGEESIRNPAVAATDALADAANAIQERDVTIFYARQQIARLEAASPAERFDPPRETVKALIAQTSPEGGSSLVGEGGGGSSISQSGGTSPCAAPATKSDGSEPL